MKEFQKRFLAKYPNIAIPDVANGLRAIKLAPVTPSLFSPGARPPAVSSFDSKEALQINVGNSTSLAEIQKIAIGLNLPPSPIP